MQRYRIAGLSVWMAASGRTAAAAAPYQTEEESPADITLTLSEEAVASSVAAHPEMSEDDWRYFLTGTLFARRLCRFDGLVLHASAVVEEGKAYLLCAPSQGGKTTLSEHWLSLYPKAYILNDDKPALRLQDGRWFVWGTPWTGQSPTGRNEQVPLGGICLLEKGEPPSVRYDDREAALRLYREAVHPQNEREMAALLSLLDRLIAEYPLPILVADPTVSSAKLAHDTLVLHKEETV